MASHKQIINDAVFGPIQLHPLCFQIMDTPEFQRLRFIKQLGGCYFVYPGASHNRFEHSIGTAYLAGEMGRHLQAVVKELNVNEDEQITDTDILCLEIAGLCHDLGHGPFSHLFDKLFIPAAEGYKWKHEEASKKMVDRILDSFDCDKIQHEHKFDISSGSKNRIFIKELIDGVAEKRKTFQGREKSKHFLYEIVSNGINSIDVDKWDYFSRDCHMLGMAHNFQVMRTMKLARVCQVEGEDKHICFPKSEYLNIFDMFSTRYILHRRAYQHRTNKAVELMIVDAFLKANKYLKFRGEEDELILSKTIKDMKAYQDVTDDVFHMILRYESPDNEIREEMKSAQRILQRILSRKLYRTIDDQIIHLKEGEDENSVENYLTEEMKKKFGDGRVVIKIVTFDYGQEAINPMEYVWLFDENLKPYQEKNSENNSLLGCLLKTQTILKGKDSPKSRLEYWITTWNVKDAISIEKIAAMMPKCYQEFHARLIWKDSDSTDIEPARNVFSTLMEERRYI